MIKLLTIPLILLSTQTLAQDYDRSQWRHWVDEDGDCQDARVEILVRDLDVELDQEFSDCRIPFGLWLDPFTGAIFSDSSDLDIDHIVPLSYANKVGGHKWSPLLKKLFANDPDNLMAVSAGQNRSKGDKGPSQYLPPDTKFHCEYIRIWEWVLRKYELDPLPEDDKVIDEMSRLCERR